MDGFEGEHTALGADESRKGDRRVAIMCTNIEPGFAAMHVGLKPSQEGTLSSAEDSAGVIVPGSVDLGSAKRTEEDSVSRQAITEQFAKRFLRLADERDARLQG